MIKIPLNELPCDESTLRAALTKYKEELIAHQSTVHVPAPWPDYEILRELVKDPEGFEVLLPPPPTPRELALKVLYEKRQEEAVRQENVALALAALEPDAPKELTDYVAANPDIAALVQPVQVQEI